MHKNKNLNVNMLFVICHLSFYVKLKSSQNPPFDSLTPIFYRKISSFYHKELMNKKMRFYFILKFNCEECVAVAFDTVKKIANYELSNMRRCIPVLFLPKKYFFNP